MLPVRFDLSRYNAPSGTSADAQWEITDEEVGFGEEEATEGTESGSVAGKDASTATEGGDGLPDLASAFKAHGLNLPGDPKELDKRYRDLESKAKMADDLQNRMNWLMHQQAQRDAQSRQEQIQRQQQEAAKPKPKIFDLPEYDPKWLDLVHRNENGELVAKPGAMPDLPQKINAYAQAREEALNRFLSDPVALFQDRFSEQIDQRASHIAQQAMAQYRQEQELRKFEAENHEWVFDRNNPTQITPAAQHWNQFYQEAMQLRHPDPVKYATNMFDALMYRVRIQEDAKQKEPSDQENKEAFLERAARKRNRDGTFEKSTRKTPPQNPGKNPWKTLDEKIKALPKEDFEDE